MGIGELIATRIGEVIATIVIGMAGSLIAAYIYEGYTKKRDKGEFKAESVALQIFDFAISMVPEEN
ncbi:MAG: hypothetical protein ACR2KT_01000 [Methylocella sp.]|nr:MAG: hypothetical protein DLM68_06985 [Hyphomicrobiales bacterium]